MSQETKQTWESRLLPGEQAMIGRIRELRFQEHLITLEEKTVMSEWIREAKGA